MLNKVNVNGVDLPLIAVQIKRGENKGSEFLSLDWENLKLADLTKAYSESRIVQSIIRPKFRTLLQNLYFDCLNDNGVLNEDEFSSCLSSLSARGETIAELQERIYECLDQFSKAKSQEEVFSIRDQMISLKEAMESKRRKTKEDREAEADGVPTA